MKPEFIKKLDRYRGDISNLKRLNGMSLTGKAHYLANTFIGEVLRRRTIGTLGLRLVEISLTDRCQCRCQHCFASNEDVISENDELSTSDVKMLLADLAAASVTEICFSGGEPLLRDDIVELVQYAHEKMLVVRLITNGILLDRKMVQNLKGAGLNWCSLSIDSPSAELHDTFRGYPGCYESVIEGLKILIESQIPCSMITVARKENIYSGALEDIIKLGIQLGVTAVRVNFPVPIGRFKNQSEEILNQSEREKVRELLHYGIVTMESPREGTKCTAAITKLNILPNGEVTPCVFVPLAYGNIRQQKFVDIWKAMDRYIQEYRIKGQCPMCDDSMREKLFKAVDAQKSL